MRQSIIPLCHCEKIINFRGNLQPIPSLRGVKRRGNPVYHFVITRSESDVVIQYKIISLFCSGLLRKGLCPLAMTKEVSGNLPLLFISYSLYEFTKHNLHLHLVKWHHSLSRRYSLPSYILTNYY